MELRRAIAAFLVFVLAGIIASPAMAAMGSCVLEESEDCCCCAEDEATEVANVSEPGCECPACACTVKQSDTSTPFYPAAESSAPSLTMMASPSSEIALASGEPLDRTATTNHVRGPPGTGPAPLYILYDTLLI